MDIPVELSRILITELGEQQVIFLKEKNGERSFPIMIGITEAMAIERRFNGVTTPRPTINMSVFELLCAMDLVKWNRDD